MKNNIIEFKSLPDKRSKIAFCLIDKTEYAATEWIRSIVKNQAEYTINNVVGKFYDLFQGLDEDQLLNHVTDLHYTHAVVFTTGTEFINGYQFFEQVEKIAETNTSLAGHILDRDDAYYELHHQCYVLNLTAYEKLGRPLIGQQELGSKHSQDKPWRSRKTYHDDYTPIWVSGGDDFGEYNHKCHGWNILSTMFDKDSIVEVFKEDIRNSKIHLYPEYINDFNKNAAWIYKRQHVCANEFIHTDNTEWDFKSNLKFKQVLTPASGIWYNAIVDPKQKTKIIFYDYNKQSLDYWKAHAPKNDNFTYEFIQLDLLADDFDIRKIIDMNLVKDTVINFSNIFCYEGTTCFYDTAYRLAKENKILSNIKAYAPESYVSFNMRSAGAFAGREHLHGQIDKAVNMPVVQLKELTKPTWRFNKEWL